MPPTPAGTTMLPPIISKICKTFKGPRDTRDCPPYILEERQRKKSTSMTNLTVDFAEHLNKKGKSNSASYMKTSYDDLSIHNPEFRYSDNNHKKKFQEMFDYDRLLLDETREFRFRLANIPPPKGQLNDFLIQKKLNCGRFGKVYLVQDVVDKKQYAMKTISKETILRDNLYQDVKAERDYLYATNSPFIVPLLHHFEDSYRVYFIQEYVSGGDLFENLVHHGPFSEELTRFYACQIILALEYMHNVHLIYRDIKPENIMIDSKGYIKLIDFGFVKKVKNRTKTFIGTRAYMAPEIVLNKAYDKNIDWWSLGVLIYEMLAGCQNTPFYDSNELVMYEKITTSRELTFPNKFPHTIVRDFIKRLLKVTPSIRLGSGSNGSRDVKNHPWFASVKWNDIYCRNVTPPARPKSLFSKSNGNYGSKLHPNNKVAALQKSLLTGGVSRPMTNTTMENRAKLEKLKKLY